MAKDLSEKPTLLIVEHSEKTREELVNSLGKHGYQVEVSDTVDSALEKSQQIPFSCIVTAIDFPDCDGLKYLEKLQKIVKTTPIIALSSNTNVSSAVATMQQGVFLLIQKPIFVMEVVRAVEEVLANKQKARGFVSIQNSLYADMNFEVPGNLGQIESVIDHIAEDVEGKVIPNSEDAAFRAVLRCALHNAVIHGHQGDENKKVKVYASLRQDQCEVVVTDLGKGFDPQSFINPDNLQGAAEKNPSGLVRIYCYMDKVSFNEDGNQIRMIKQRQ